MNIPDDPSDAKKEQDAFIEILRQNHQLADVPIGSDLEQLKSELPPHISHVCFPDGRLERIRFSNPYTGRG